LKVDGTKEFEAPAQTVWEVLNDPTRLAQLLPGVQSFDVQDERHWTANVKVPLGMGGLALKFKFEKTEERPIEYARLSAKGQGVGAIVNMDTQFHLDAQGERTAMRWECDVRVAGPVGSMGQRVFQPIVNQQVTNVLNALERQVQDAKAAGAAAPAPAEPSAGAETSGAPEGIHATAPESYSAEPEGPTHSTQD
jgi:carbon monoxide dehydrogenase subunit G